MTNDWNWHVESLKSRLNELNETVETIRLSVDKRPGLAEATHAISSLMSSAGSLGEGLARFPGVVSEILENSVLGAVLIGPEGQFLLHNQTAGEILGYNFILNRDEAQLLLENEEGHSVQGDDLPWLLALHGEPVTDKRLHLKADDDESGKWITFSATPFINNDQTVGGVMLFMLDTTEEVVIEESIESICQTISDQIAQVGSTQDQLQELANKLAKTGVQRLLSDRGTGTGDKNFEEQSRPKKFIARHTEEEVDSDSLSASNIENHLEPEALDTETDQASMSLVADEHNQDLDEIEEEAYLVHDSSTLVAEVETAPEKTNQEEVYEEIEEDGFYQVSTPIDHNEDDDDSFIPIEEDSFLDPSQASQDIAAAESSSSPESLFGKMADLTQKSSSEEVSSEDPWPEVVDTEDYGQNLWEEYTQTDETTSSAWEEDDNRIESEVSSEEEEEEASVDFEELDTLEASLNEVDEDSLETSIETEYSHVEESNEELAQTEYIEEEEEEEEEEAAATAKELEEEEEHTIEAEFHQLEENREVEEEEAHDSARDAVKGGKSLRNTLFGKKKKRSTRNSGTYAAIGGPNELDASYLNDDEDVSESMVVSYAATEEVTKEPEHNRVLVVDDIPVNQKLLLLHLKRLGYEADVANNGKEALEAMEKQQYQVVLMDCDMPVMNGFEASTKIRATEAYSHRRVPIIALTSYDREGDREKCIAAGMDDYITKGSSRKELKDAIERSIVSAQEKSRDVNATTSDEDLHADVEPLDINSMLKLYGQEEVEEISRLFLSNMAAYIECMQLAIDEKDADSVVHFANAVKGPCAALGMKLMTRLTTDIIDIAEKEDWTSVRVKYMRLKAVFVQTQEELKKVCPDDSLISK